MSSAKRTVAIGHCSHKGPRDTNQDGVRDVLLPDGGWLLAVADGMGGLEAGEVASRLALDVLEQRVVAGSALGRAVRSANAELHQRAGGEAMGTTIVAATVAGGGIRFANVGDSRAYYLDTLGLTQITTDHTMAAEAAKNSVLVGAEMASTRWGGTLTRALGMSTAVEVDEFGPLSLSEGSWVILCTDGVYRAVSHGEMEECVREGTEPQTVADRLVALALENGTEDNATAAVMRITGIASPFSGSGGNPTASTPWDPRRFLSKPDRRASGTNVTRFLVFLSIVVVAALVTWVIFIR